jgi:sodium/potassium-transporting ATPase subunit alpha
MVNVIGILVAFIPTGLPVAVTLSLLLMARKMAKHKVLVKNLTTIETLSSVNVIASDKTGTLTQNKMFVSSALAGLDVFDMRNIEKTEKTNSFKHLVATAFLCNNASFIDDKENESLQISMKKG